jgi:flagellin-like hook-associated protein FlgL
MIPRATTNGLVSRLASYSSLHGTRLLQLQDQLSSGIRIRKSSDDPLAFRQITSIQSQLKHLDDATYVIQEAEGKLNASVSNLTEFQQLLSSAQRLGQEGVQALSQEERNALALEAEGLLTRLKDLANARFNGQYLYGGAASERIPYNFAEGLLPGRALEVSYSGAEKSGESVISPSVSIETLYAGDDVFGAGERGPTILYGKSGARVGSGTDTMRGRATLQIRHTLTTYLGAAGLSAGSGSPGNDAVLGPAGTNTVSLIDTSGTGAGGTISLNGGPPIAWDSSQTNLEVNGPNGERIFVNTTAIAAGFSGSVDLTGDGTLSVDGGATTTNIDFSASQVVTDSLTGRRVSINSSAVNRTGDDYLEFTGTSNAFQALDELIQDLRGTRTLDNAQYAEAVARRMGEMEKIADRVLTAVGLQATSLEGLEQLKNRNQDLRSETEIRLGDLQNTDFTRAVVELTNEQMLQQFTFSVASQIMNQSLIDFLR